MKTTIKTDREARRSLGAFKAHISRDKATAEQRKATVENLIEFVLTHAQLLKGGRR